MYLLLQSLLKRRHQIQKYPSDLVGSTDWIRLAEKFYAVLGYSQPTHFQDCIAQATPKEKLMLYTILNNKERSLTDETA